MVTEFVAAIKSKKGLENLDDSFVRERIEKILRSDARIKEKYEKSKSFKQFARSKEFETVLKAVRKELRTIYGVFQEGKRDITEDVTAILATHVSTRERLPYYNRIYKELADRIPSPKTIVDLGCGLNPLSFNMMKKHGWQPAITGIDISSADMRFLANAMRRLNIPGKTMTLDLTKQYETLDRIHADVTLVLKLLDTLEETHRHISYKLFEHIKTTWIVVSFPTKSLGGNKRISMKGRSWFERLLHRFEYAWETFSVENELFYVIQR